MATPARSSCLVRLPLLLEVTDKNQHLTEDGIRSIADDLRDSILTLQEYISNNKTLSCISVQDIVYSADRTAVSLVLGYNSEPELNALYQCLRSADNELSKLLSQYCMDKSLEIIGGLKLNTDIKCRVYMQKVVYLKCQLTLCEEEVPESMQTDAGLQTSHGRTAHGDNVLNTNPSVVQGTEIQRQTDSQPGSYSGNGIPATDQANLHKLQVKGIEGQRQTNSQPGSYLGNGLPATDQANLHKVKGAESQRQPESQPGSYSESGIPATANVDKTFNVAKRNMTARQQSLSAKLPRYAAVYFPKDNTTGIAPVSNMQGENLSKDSSVTCTWNGEEVEATIIMLSNSRATLDEAIDEFELPADVDNNSRKSTKKKKTISKPAKEDASTAQMVDSGAAAPSEEIDTPDAAYETDAHIDAIVQLSSEGRTLKSTQTPTPELVHNSTQTLPDCRAELFEEIIKKIHELDSNLASKFRDLETKLMERCDTLEKKIDSRETDVYEFQGSPVSTPQRPPRVTAPQTPRTPQQKRLVTDLGFWKLTPSEILGKDPSAVLQTAATKTPLSNPEISSQLLDQIKGESMNQRTLFAKNMMNCLFTVDELYNKNVNGRVSHGVNKSRLNPIKVDSVREQVFKFFPCVQSEQKKLWAECVKVMDKANLYLFSVIQRKFDLSQIIDYL